MRGNSSDQIKSGQADRSKDQKQERHPGRGPGKLNVVSIGPGDPNYLTPKAHQVLQESEVIVGYRTYMALIEPRLLDGKTTISTGMRDEIHRCQMAIEQALSGKITSVISSGDAGIYGMAGLILELMEEKDLIGQLEIEIIPGVPAFSAAAALLGAPLMHDFAVISLSDLMTPWEMIRSRIDAAARADFVIVIYNPRSKKRDWQLNEALGLIHHHREPNTPVGLVRNAMREGQIVQTTTLSKLDATQVDMLTILLIGNSRTRNLMGKMTTPRGYLEKYNVK